MGMSPTGEDLRRAHPSGRSPGPSPGSSVGQSPGGFGRFAALSRALFSEIVDLLYPTAPPCLLCRGPGDIDRSIAVCTECIRRLVPIGSRRCARCGRAVGARSEPEGGSRGHFNRIAGRPRTLTCAQCLRTGQGFDYCRAYGVYEGYLRTLIHQLKYGGDAAIARGLGELMAWVVARDGRFGRIDAVVPIPLHPRRFAERGFNQAALLALAIARQINRPMGEPVVRIQETSPQSKLPMNERARNVRRAFAVPRPDEVRDKRVLLVDDVLTTGATLSAAARALKRAGARRCVAVCAAASSLDRDFDQTAPEI